MAHYTCPLCQKKLERDLVLFTDHTNDHIIEAIKKDHPEWVQADGVCEPCTEYYKMQLSGEFEEFNLGPKERGRRFIFGIFSLILTLAVVVWIQVLDFGLFWKLSIFIPLAFSLFCLFECKHKTCAILSEMGFRNMDTGPQEIQNEELKEKIRTRGRKIIFQSVGLALVLTLIFCTV